MENPTVIASLFTVPCALHCLPFECYELVSGLNGRSLFFQGAEQLQESLSEVRGLSLEVIDIGSLERGDSIGVWVTPDLHDCFPGIED